MNISVSRRRWALPFAALALAIVASAAPGLAQERFGALTGIVKDDTGAVLPGVTVAITNKATGKVYTVVSGNDGGYRLLDLEPGRYSVRFELARVLRGRITGCEPAAREDPRREPGHDRGRRERGHHGERRLPAHRYEKHDDRSQRDRRGIRPDSEGPQLPEPRHFVSVRERGRGRRRHPGQRGERIRKFVHDRWRGHEQHRERRSPPGRGLRVPAGSSGQDRRHQRGVRRRARRRHQRGDQVGRQHLPRRRPLLLQRIAPERRASEAAGAGPS